MTPRPLVAVVSWSSSNFKRYLLLLQWSDFHDNTTIRLEIELAFKNGFSILNFLSKNGILPKNGIFAKKRNTLNIFWFSWNLVSRLIRLCWFQKSDRFGSRTPHSRVKNFGSTFSNDYFSENPFLTEKFRIENPFVKASSISTRMVVLSSKSDHCSKSR